VSELRVKITLLVWKNEKEEGRGNRLWKEKKEVRAKRASRNGEIRRKRQYKMPAKQKLRER